MEMYNNIRKVDVTEKAASVYTKSGGELVLLPFYCCGKWFDCSDSPKWGMSLRKAGSMRFRWNEQNNCRTRFLERLCGPKGVTPVSLELVHSKEVCALNSALDTDRKQADGMITLNRGLLPVVTVADCMPIFLFDPVTGMFGVLHSGWKGTGIAAAALEKAEKLYGVKPADVCIALGPHIRECCYIVNEERAEYFRKNFTDECVMPVSEAERDAAGPVKNWNTAGGKLFRLSLEQANIALLLKIGVSPDHIVVASDCTCCNELFGSYRRETSESGRHSGRAVSFTVQAAFCGCI